MELSPQRRQTRQRQLVYATVAETASHPTAEWVYERVRRRMPRVSLGTVYRNLQLLVSEGLLRSWTRGRITRYDADLAPHDHFSCRRCGLLLDLERATQAFSEERRLRARGHQIEERILEFIGVCRQCRRNRKTGGKKRWFD
jgi:Fe2+ or Zn2+ uptake regulation protein